MLLSKTAREWSILTLLLVVSLPFVVSLPLAEVASAQSWSPPVDISQATQPANAIARLTDSFGDDHVIFWAIPGTGTIQLFHTWKSGGGAFSTPVQVSHTLQRAVLPPAPFAHAMNSFLTPGSTAPRRDYEYSGYRFFQESADGLELFFESVPGTGVSQIWHTIFDGTSWSAPVNVSQSTQPASAVAFEIDSLGTGHVIWWAIPGTGTLQLHYASRTSGGSWSAPVQLSNTGQFAKMPPATLQDRCLGFLLPAPLDDLPFPERDTEYSGYRFLLEDDVGNLHFFFESIPGLGVSQVWHMKLDVSNLAGGWSTPVDISQASQPADAIGIVKDSDGALQVIFQAIPGAGTAQLFHTTLASGGTTWTTPVNVSQSSGVSMLPPALYAEGTGGFDCLHVPVANLNPVNPELDYQYSAQQFFRQVGRELHLFFESVPGASPAQLFNAHLDLDNLAAGWSTPVDVSVLSQPVSGVGIEEDSTGTLHVLFSGIPGTGTLQLHHTYRPAAGSWTAPVQVSHTVQPATFAAGLVSDPELNDISSLFAVDVYDYEYSFYDFLWEDSAGYLNFIFDSVPNVGVQQVWHTRLQVSNPAGGWSAPTNVSQATQPASSVALEEDAFGQPHLIFTAIPGTGSLQLFHSVYDPTLATWTTPIQASHTVQEARLAPAIIADPYEILEFDYEYSSYQFLRPDSAGRMHLYFDSVPNTGVQQVFHTVYTPEPGLALGVTAGALAMALGGRRTRRRCSLLGQSIK